MEAEVEAQAFGRDVTALLLYFVAEYLAQSRLQQVCSRV